MPQAFVTPLSPSCGAANAEEWHIIAISISWRLTPSACWRSRRYRPQILAIRELPRRRQAAACSDGKGHGGGSLANRLGYAGLCGMVLGIRSFGMSALM